MGEAEEAEDSFHCASKYFVKWFCCYAQVTHPPSALAEYPVSFRLVWAMVLGSVFCALCSGLVSVWLNRLTSLLLFARLNASSNFNATPTLRMRNISAYYYRCGKIFSKSLCTQYTKKAEKYLHEFISKLSFSLFSLYSFFFLSL